MPRALPIETWDAAGARLRVRTGGAAAGTDAPTLVMALDPPNVLEHYAHPFVAFRKRARLVAFEPPGFGHSRAPKGFGHTLEEAADVVVALLERLRAPRPAVLAFPCLAAYVALHVAHRRPDLVGGLVLAQSPSWTQEAAWAARVDRRGVLRTPLVGQAALLVRGDPLIQGWYDAATADPAQARHLGAIAIEALDHGAKFPLAGAFQALFRGEPPEIPTARVPTLHVWGARDRSHRHSDPETIRQHAPDAEVLVMDDVGHFPELEAPGAWRDAVLGWMGRRGLA